MKKNLLTMLAAILICGLTVTTLSACSSDDDKNDKADATVEKEIMYAVQISDDVLVVSHLCDTIKKIPETTNGLGDFLYLGCHLDPFSYIK